MYWEVGKQSKGRIRFLAVKSNWEPVYMADSQLPWVVPGIWSWEGPQDQVIDVEGTEPLTSRAKPEQMSRLPLYSTATGRNMPDPHGCCRDNYPRSLSKQCLFLSHSHDMLRTKSGFSVCLPSTVLEQSTSGRDGWMYPQRKPRWGLLYSAVSLIPVAGGVYQYWGIYIVRSKVSPLYLWNSWPWLRLHLQDGYCEVAELLVSDAVSAASCLLEIQ